MKPTKIQAWVFKRVGDNINYLLLKRIPSRGGFWQPVTGRIEEGENDLDATKRELKEETGISTVIETIENVYEFTLEDSPGDKEVVHAFEVEPELQIVLDENIYPEHDELRWAEYEDCLELLKWPQNKEALKALKEKLE